MAELEAGKAAGPVLFVGELSQVERGEVAGYNAKVTGNYVQLFPRISKKDYAELVDLRLPECPGYLEAKLATLTQMAAGDKAGYLANHKAVLRERDGETEVMIVPRTAMGKDEVDLDPDEDGVVDKRLELDGRAKTRKYTLTQVLRDASVFEKYKFTPRQVESVRRIAATNPVSAASVCQDIMNTVQFDVYAVVTTGNLLRDKNHARNAIRVFSRSYVTPCVTVHSYVIGPDLFMFGPKGEEDWHVRGSLENAVAVRDLHTLMCHIGEFDIAEYLGLEIAMLSLNVWAGETYAAPTVNYHMGTPTTPVRGMDSSIRTQSLLSVEQRMEVAGFTDRLLPVHDELGNQVATAVRVTGRHILLNAHVLDSLPMCSVEGAIVTTHKMVARDVWSALLPGDSAPWRVRNAEVDEMAMICYRSGGSVVYTSPVRIVSIDDACIVTTKVPEAVEGTSGGALVALSDMSLLGVHSAETNRNLLAYAFGTRQFAELLEGDDVSAVSRKSDDDSFGQRAYDYFKKRGLGHVVQAAMSSLVPVFVDYKHVGMAASNGAELFTTCDPELPLRLGPKRLPAVFTTVDSGQLYRTANPYPSLQVPVYRRAPVYFERVFVIGFDDEDVFFSPQTSVAHIGPNAKNFVIKDMAEMDKPLCGGLVVAWDGAILGQCGQRSMSTAVGAGFVCRPLPESVAVKFGDPVGVMQKKFPFLNMDAWSSDILEEIFTHTSVGKYKVGRPFNGGNKPLANVGDNVAKAELYYSLREAMIPHPRWSGYMQDLQSNISFAAKAWEFGLADCLIVGPAVSLPRESKSYADLMEAVIGAVYVVERPEIVRRFCQAVGIVYIAVDATQVLGFSPVD